MVADVLTRSAAARPAAAPLSGLAGAWHRLRRRDTGRGAVEPTPAWLTMPPERPLPTDLDLPIRLFDPAAFARAAPGVVAPRAMPLEPLLLDETLQRLRRLVA